MENAIDNRQILRDKVAVITGAASGIGKETTVTFLAEGAKVVAADINAEALEALTGELAGYGDALRTFQVNTAVREQVEAMIDYAVSEFGKMDVIYNNAGVMDGMVPVAELDDATWDRVMSINTNGVMYACRKAVQYFLERGEGGVILNTASLGGLRGGRAGFAYTASKHAVVGMTKNIAFMYGTDGIRCNAICPGGVATNVGLGMKTPSERGLMKTMPGVKMMDRVGDPKEIASAAVWLASDSASFVNGESIAIDGGWSAF